MKRRLPALVLALILLTGLAAVCAEASGITTSNTVMYVYTDNGKDLNVRSAPYVGNNIIGLAKYGSKLTIVRFLDTGWACINWPNYGEAYVQSRYLQWYAPAGYATATPSPVPTAVPTAVPYLNNNTNNYNGYSYTESGYAYTDSLATLNAEFRTARIVSPFTITVRPTRASGWGNMRWAPSKDTEVISTYRTGAQLTVIAETQSWYQVVDTNTDATGFMMKAYTIRQR